MQFSDSASPADHARITELLGRAPQGNFDVVVRNSAGEPIVVRNAPLLHDGTPMPTRFWLVGTSETIAVGRIESTGGVNQAEAEIDPQLIAATHTRYATERDAQIASSHTGPRPHGGVGGTRMGVKCLHAHFGYWLAGGDDPVGAWVAAKLGTQRRDYLVPNAVAAIDIGTNSTNLLIVASDGNELAREVHITRIGEGIATTGTLSTAAMARTLERLGEYKMLLANHPVSSLRIVATEACRRASNVDAFFTAVDNLLGVRPELITGLEEGRLAYRGALTGFEPSNEPTLVIDIGGGSTEIMIGTTDFAQVASIPVGAVMITEQELHRDPPRPEELTNAIGLASDFVDDIIRNHPGVLGATHILGVAGTVVTVAAVELGLQTFDAARLHGMNLSRSAVEDVFRTLATEKLADRLHNPGLPEQRADIIVGGCCILVAIMRKLQINSITVSTRNILDGIAAELLSGQS